LKKEELISKSIDINLKSKEKILEKILTVVREEEKIESKKDDLNILVLLLIQRKDMYGYAVIKEMELKSKGKLSMNEGEVYPVLHSMENRGLLEAYWKDEDEIEKKYYKLTRKGKEYLKTKTEEVKKFSFLGDIQRLHKIN
jgi:PadR family transcriptional regulator, regulatory protein PadR